MFNKSIRTAVVTALTLAALPASALAMQPTHGSNATHDLIVHRAPKPVLTADRSAALVGQQVNYNGAGSTDDNGIANYSWDLDGDGTFETNTGTTPTASKSYDTIGPRSVKL